MPKMSQKIRKSPARKGVEEMKQKICRICKEELKKGWHWLGKPFYKNEYAVCKECYLDAQIKIKAKAEDL